MMGTMHWVRRRHIERRVFLEEAVRKQRHIGIVARHDRPVLGTREMREPECVPEHDILILNGFVACRIRRQAGTARILVDQIARRPLLALAIRSEEHTSELQSLMRISYAVFCLKKKTDTKAQLNNITTTQ